MLLSLELAHIRIYLIEVSNNVAKGSHRVFSVTQPVTVGIALAGDPPYRSVRAALPHTAPTSGDGVEAYVRIRMQNLRCGYPKFDQPSKPFPGHAVTLASTP